MADRPRNAQTLLLTRRNFALAAGAAMAAGYAGSGRPATARALPSLDENVILDFLNLSRFLTGHAHLAAATGEALLDGLTKLHPNFPDQIASLSAQISNGKYADIEAFEAAIRSDPVHPLVMQIIRGWYAGILEDGSMARVYACESALMYQSTNDNVPVPTYAHNGPNYWTAEPNPVTSLPNF